MRNVIRLSGVLGGVIILLGLFFTGLVGATPGGVQSPPLHYKSRLGLMPSAYTGPTYHSPLRLRASASLRFLNPYITVTVGSWPQVLTLADFTGDALNDVALATDNNFDPQNDEQLHLFAGQAGDLVSRTQRLPAGSGPEAITTGDFDANGQPDVALALSGENAVLVYTQTAGVGLNAPVTLSLLGEPNAVAAGDFSGDLHDDLAAIAPLSGTIVVWRWGGETPAPTVLPYPTGGYDALAAGDLDNDGDDDLVALRGAGYLTDSVVIYWQDAGYFPISTTLTPETGGYLPHSLAVGDVNGDGMDDLVVTAGGNAPDAFLNAFLQGAGGLATTPVTYPAFHLPSAVAIGDVDHDGLNDVVVAHDAWQTLSVFTQTVSGTLSAYATAPIPYSDRYRPAALGLADLDGNGSLDVALVDRDHGLTILTNTLTAPTAVIMSPTHATVLSPGPITITGSASNAVTVEVRLKGDTEWMTTTLNGAAWEAALVLPAEERAWWIEARAIDAQGRVQAPVDGVRIGVEAGGPQGSLLINAGAYATTQPTVTLTLAAVDFSGVAAMRFSLDQVFFGEWVTYTATYSWPFAAGDGLKTLYAQFRDTPGHVSAWVSDSIILDTTPPSSTVATLPTTTYQTTHNLTWSGADAGSGLAAYAIQMRTDGESWTSLLAATPLTETILRLPAAHTYCFRSQATDHAGHVEAWPAGDGDTCMTIVTDLEPPVGEFTINEGAAFTRQPTVTLYLTATDVSGVTGMRFSPDALTYTAWISYATTYSWTFAGGDGAKTLYAQFQDTPGNTSAVVSASILLDTIPPASTVAPLLLTTTQPTFTVTWTGTDAGSGVVYYDIAVWNEPTALWQTWLTATQATQAAFTGETAGRYCFRSRATDRAGNVEAWPTGDGDTCTTISPLTYGVTLTPDSDNAIGNPGQTVTYTLQVHNTSSVPDTYTVTLGAHTWEATPASATFGPVAADATATLAVYVTLPAAAAEGDSETMTVQVTSHGDGESGATAQLTTWATVQPIHRGVRLAPATALKVTAPGDSVTYTLLVENTGKVPDDYMLSIAGATWPTAVTPPTLRWLAAGATARVVVSVTIPVDALAGAADTAQVTVASQDASGVQATATLQTVAYTTAITRGLEIAPLTQNGTGVAGAVVTYTATVTNTGNVTDTVTLATTANGWPIQITPTAAILPAATPLTMIISVTVPATATVRMVDHVTLTAWGTGASVSSELTTAVLESTSYIYTRLGHRLRFWAAGL